MDQDANSRILEGDEFPPPPEASPHWTWQAITLVLCLVVGGVAEFILLRRGLASGSLTWTINYSGGYLIVQAIVVHTVPRVLFDADRSRAVRSAGYLATGIGALAVMMFWSAVG